MEGFDHPEREHRTWSRRLTEPADHGPIPPPTARPRPVEDGGVVAAGAPRRPRRGAGFVVSCIALVLIVGAVTIGLVATSGPPAPGGAGGSLATPRPGASQNPGAGVTPAAFVVSSTRTTLQQHTADVAISGGVSANGQTVPIEGTGYADFDNDAFSANMTMDTPTGGFGEDEIVVGGQIYLSLGADGVSISQLTGGPHWVNVPVPQQDSSEVGTGNVDPLGQLQLLTQQGATVSQLGATTIDGEAVSGYSVTPSQAEEQQSLQDEVRSGDIPPSVVPMLEQELQAIGTPTMDAYFDGTGLLRKLSVTFGGGSSPVSASVQMTFEDYGTSVSIAPPVSSDVVSYGEFVQDVQASGGPAS